MTEREEALKAARQMSKSEDEIVKLKDLLRRALPSVHAEAMMMDAIDRHAPLPEAEMSGVTQAADKLSALHEEITEALRDCTFAEPDMGLENRCYSACRASRKDGECIWDKCPAKGDRLFNHCPLADVCKFHGTPRGNGDAR